MPTEPKSVYPELDIRRGVLRATTPVAFKRKKFLVSGKAANNIASIRGKNTARIYGREVLLATLQWSEENRIFRLYSTDCALERNPQLSDVLGNSV